MEPSLSHQRAKEGLPFKAAGRFPSRVFVCCRSKSVRGRGDRKW